MWGIDVRSIWVNSSFPTRSTTHQSSLQSDLRLAKALLRSFSSSLNRVWSSLFDVDNWFRAFEISSISCLSAASDCPLDHQYRHWSLDIIAYPSPPLPDLIYSSWACNFKASLRMVRYSAWYRSLALLLSSSILLSVLALCWESLETWSSPSWRSKFLISILRLLISVIQEAGQMDILCLGLAFFLIFKFSLEWSFPNQG